MLIDETAGSGGDLLPWMFRKAGLGPLIGRRTWGGLVGILGFPVLMDGGYVTAPNLGIWTEDGFVVENVGVPPDIEVEQLPALVEAGRDPQLEKAIEVVLEALEANPPVKRETTALPDPRAAVGETYRRERRAGAAPPVSPERPEAHRQSARRWFELQEASTRAAVEALFGHAGGTCRTRAADARQGGWNRRGERLVRPCGAAGSADRVPEGLDEVVHSLDHRSRSALS